MVFSRILAGLAALLLLPVAACSSGPPAQDIAAAFAKAMAAGDAVAAAGQTDAPEQARAELEAIRKDLSPTAVHTEVGVITEQHDGATAPLNLSWDFGSGRLWRYSSELALIDGDQGWKVHWVPSLIHPQLRAGQRLALRETRPDPQPVRDRDGKQLMGAEKVVTVSLSGSEAGDVRAVANTLAQALGGVDQRITPQTIVDGVAKTPQGQPYVVATLRQGDFDKVRASIYDLPGVRFPAQTKLVTPERGYATQVLAGVAKQVDDQVTANAGWRVVTVDASGKDAAELQSVPEKPVAPTNITLSDGMQRAAETAMDPVPQAAMLVAMQPSTGELLAVAQNAPADAQGPVALTGQYPPGSTFKIITATAGLEAGKVNINSPVDCPGKKVFDGRTLPNDKEFDLGRVPLLQAFAKSCNTTFAQLGVDLPVQSLAETAKQFGIGVDYTMAGATTITGKVGTADAVTQKAENGIGQGKVLASPFGMALAASTAASGKLPLPILVRGVPTAADATPQPVAADSLNQLRTMMREVVLSGTATSLGGSGDVRGKTGTAQFGDGTHSHGWFVGYRGDLAVAVLITDAGSSGPAVEATKRFLAGV